MQKNLLVCSVFAGTGEHNPFWLQMQLERLRQSRGDTFDHAVYLNGADDSLFEQSFIVGSSPVADDASRGHMRGLQALRRYCIDHSYYSHYLFLDSDCFPIRNDWLEVLSERLKHFGKSYAAVMRAENLDTFPHPCVLFTSDISCVEFIDVPEGSNLLGIPLSDVCCGGDRRKWLPLLRTNRIARHPTIGSVYYDLFYHHGCGSRPFDMRSTAIGYYDRTLEGYADFDTLTAELRSDPALYLRTLGVKP